MSFKARIEYLLRILERYFLPSTTKLDKTRMLDEYCKICGLNRKYAIYQINNYDPNREKKTKGRQSKYGTEVIYHLKKLYFYMDQICSKKMKAAIPIWLPLYEEPMSQECRTLLLSISAPTIDRLLRETKKAEIKKRNCTTKPGSIIKSRIPIKTLDADIKEPGFIEADTVAHCGNSLSGDFIWSITYTDVFSGWTSNRAVWNKGSQAIIDKTKEVFNLLPFDVLSISVDNGSEFLNWALLDMLGKKKIDLYRSRPYKKNDNCRVEQKNWTHVRSLFGYDRFDSTHLVFMINNIYINYWNPYQNFFIPTIKLIQKTRIGAKIIKKYDSPQTPYKRILGNDKVPIAAKEKLQAVFKRLNPFVLKKNIDEEVRKVIAYNNIGKNKVA